MGSPLYTPSGAPVQGSKGASQSMRNEFSLVETALDKLNAIPFFVSFEDLNAPGSRYVAVPWAGSIVGCYVVNSAANATAQTVITLEIGGALVAMPALAVPSAAAIGTVNSAVPTAANTFSAGGSVEVISNGGGTSVMPSNVTLLIARSS